MTDRVLFWKIVDRFKYECNSHKADTWYMDYFGTVFWTGHCTYNEAIKVAKELALTKNCVGLIASADRDDWSDSVVIYQYVKKGEKNLAGCKTSFGCEELAPSNLDCV